MIIFQLVTKRQYRGAEVFAALLSSHLSGEGNDVFFIGLIKSQEPVLCAQNCTNIDLNGSNGKFHLPMFWRLANLVRRYRPDIIQANGSETLKYGLLLKLIFPGISVTYRNISIISHWLKNRILKKIYRILFQKIDFVTSVSDASRIDFIKTLNYPENRIQVVRRGVVLDNNANTEKNRENLRRQLNIPPDHLVLIHIGSFSKEKNHRFLLNSFQKAILQVPNLQLWLLGDGPEKPAIEAMAQNLGIASEKILFWGIRRNVEEFLAAADLLVICSLIEGIPGVVMEAATQNIPTLAIDVGGIKEVVISNKTGILLPDHNEDSFIKRLVELASDRTVLQTLGTNARQYFETRYDIKQTTKQFQKIYAMLRS